MATDAGGGWYLNRELGHVKDFNRSGVSGNLGAGFALLQMYAAGYIWGVHWEDCGAPARGKRPDFVFFRPAGAGRAAACIMEAKGARNTSMSAMQKHWFRQIWPNKDEVVKLPGFGPMLPTEGRVVGTELGGPRCERKIRSFIAHGEFQGAGPNLSALPEQIGADGVLPDLLAAQRASMVNICKLLDMPETAEQMRSATSDKGFATHPRVSREMGDRVRELAGGLPGISDLPQAAAFVAPFTRLRPSGHNVPMEAAVYCEAEILAGAVRGEVEPSLPDVPWLQGSFVDEGRWALRVQAPDGVGLILRTAHPSR
ncbi:hypothetical protein [Cupriavidus pauculus]|uniref:hypothetical protein n=1 Tax=Cupriavidus pauculus TaxID=82633 RepID=UPI001EE29C51|nr:hypothetical protein [Cupriavidus pauculus]GJG96836.1 hypothetical protein CBA19C6_20125 [Cupriavidus pauculus]